MRFIDKQLKPKSNRGDHGKSSLTSSKHFGLFRFSRIWCWLFVAMCKSLVAKMQRSKFRHYVQIYDVTKFLFKFFRTFFLFGDD